MASYLIGLDHGTGGAKACIIDDQANILAYAYREYPIYASHSGWSEHDPHLYWQTACEVVDEADYDLGYTSIDGEEQVYVPSPWLRQPPVVRWPPKHFPVGLGRGRRVNIDPVN